MDVEMLACGSRKPAGVASRAEHRDGPNVAEYRRIEVHGDPPFCGERRSRQGNLHLNPAARRRGFVGNLQG